MIVIMNVAAMNIGMNVWLTRVPLWYLEKNFWLATHQLGVTGGIV